MCGFCFLLLPFLYTEYTYKYVLRIQAPKAHIRYRDFYVPAVFERRSICQLLPLGCEVALLRPSIVVRGLFHCAIAVASKYIATHAASSHIGGHFLQETNIYIYYIYLNLKDASYDIYIKKGATIRVDARCQQDVSKVYIQNVRKLKKPLNQERTGIRGLLRPYLHTFVLYSYYLTSTSSREDLHPSAAQTNISSNKWRISYPAGSAHASTYLNLSERTTHGPNGR